MKEYAVTKDSAGQRADRFLSRAAPGLPPSAIQKAFRKKDVKRNGRPCRADERLAEGDVVRVYALDAHAHAQRKDERVKMKEYGTLGVGSIVYEDERMLVLHKPPGVPSQPDFEEMARAYVRNCQLSIVNCQLFTPSLCHRLDRNTEGLLLFAKTGEALRDITEKIRRREVVKTYRCAVEGVPSPAKGEWRDYLWKDAVEKRVYARKSPSPGAKEAVLRYAVLQSVGGKSLLEIELVTGRTHQIRVQCASRGFPVLGDGKYGKGRKGEPLALCAVKIKLDGRVFEIGAGAPPFRQFSV
ncbi:MAG: RluA family pseudouridine synthase [Oscillospiraceae bacterium]|nr:RluA family pseudouridine synthase [Oscillospiraceae bacterium]